MPSAALYKEEKATPAEAVPMTRTSDRPHAVTSHTPSLWPRYSFSACKPNVLFLKLDTNLLVDVLYVSFSRWEIWLPAAQRSTKMRYTIKNTDSQKSRHSVRPTDKKLSYCWEIWAFWHRTFVHWAECLNGLSTEWFTAARPEEKVKDKGDIGRSCLVWNQMHLVVQTLYISNADHNPNHQMEMA